MKSSLIERLACCQDGRASNEWIKNSHQLPYKLYEVVHPSLEQSAMMLEFASYNLDVASKFMVVSACPANWFLLCAFDVICMAACISRASRSYCIGLRNADDERIMTNAFCHRKVNDIKELIETCCYGDHQKAVLIPKKPFDIFGVQVPQHPFDNS
ncbi:hypothetical protein ACOME3_009351 [Neoechinorhynchus agilis]